MRKTLTLPVNLPVLDRNRLIEKPYRTASY